MAQRTVPIWLLLALASLWVAVLWVDVAASRAWWAALLVGVFAALCLVYGLWLAWQAGHSFFGRRKH